MFEGLTKLGSMHQAKCQANEVPIRFSKVKIGNGILLDSEDPTELIDIKSLKKEVDIVEKTQVEDAVRMLVQIDNTGVIEGYYPREIGIYAMDGEVEILYWYINDGNECSYLTPASKAPIKFKIWVNLLATSLESVIVNWTGKELWVDREYLGKELEKKQDMTDNRLLTTTKKIWEAINELFNNKLEKGGYIGTAKNLLDEISKKASKTLLGRMIVGKGMTADSAGRVSIISKNDGIIVNDNDIQLNIIDNLTTNSSTRSLSAKQGKKLFDEKQNITDTTLPTTAKTITGSIKELFTGKVNNTDIVNNLTTTSTGKVLDGRQGPAIVNKINGLAGGYSGAFPLTTAVKEGIYLLPATNKFYVCVENYSGSSLTAPNANFEELSVFQNRNKLENLCNNDWKLISTLTTINSKITISEEYSIIKINCYYSPTLMCATFIFNANENQNCSFFSNVALEGRFTLINKIITLTGVGDESDASLKIYVKN